MTSEQRTFLEVLILEMDQRIRPFVRDEFTREQTEEIMQETYLAASENIDTLMTHENPYGWLVSTAHHRSSRMRAWLRKERNRYTELPDPDELSEETDEPQEPDFFRIEHIDCTLDNILSSQTSEEDRLLFKMHYDRQLTVDEMGEKLHIKPNAVKQKLFRARKRQKKYLQEQNEQDT